MLNPCGKRHREEWQRWVTITIYTRKKLIPRPLLVLKFSSITVHAFFYMQKVYQWLCSLSRVRILNPSLKVYKYYHKLAVYLFYCLDCRLLGRQASGFKHGSICGNSIACWEYIIVGTNSRGWSSCSSEACIESLNLLINGVSTAAVCEELESSFTFHLDLLYYEDLVWTNEAAMPSYWLWDECTLYIRYFIGCVCIWYGQSCIDACFVIFFKICFYFFLQINQSAHVPQK